MDEQPDRLQPPVATLRRTGASCTDIGTATGSTYTLTAADAGSTLRVIVTATNAAGSSTATSAQTPVVTGPPVNTVLPAITGSTVVGQTLTASNGSWAGNPTGYSRQWQRCDTHRRQLHRHRRRDRLHLHPHRRRRRLHPARDRHRDERGRLRTATSAQTPVVAGPPVNTVLPAITGSTVVGQTLTADTGVWTNSPTGFSRQWQRCDSTGAACTDIGAATASTYVLAAADAGSTLRVIVTATNAAGSTSATLGTDLAHPVERTPTAWTDDARRCRRRRRQRLHRRLRPVHALLDSAADRPDRLPPRRQLGPADPDADLHRQRRTARHARRRLPAGDDRRRPGSRLGRLPAHEPPDPRGRQVLARVLVQRLRCPGLLRRRPGFRPLRRRPVFRHGKSAGQLRQRQRLQSRVLLYATLGSIAPAGPVNTTLPAITGSTVVGQTLTASNGSWAGNPTGYSRQWQRCDAAGASCTDIGAATASTYVLAAADAGSTLRVIVTATNAAGSNTATSTQTPVVTGPPVNTVLPAITGSTVVGQTLTAERRWTGNPTGYSRQWQRCDSTGAACTDIGAATASTYMLAAADAGSTLRVIVTATNAAGSAQATSAPTALVQSNAPLPLGRTIPGAAAAGGGSGFIAVSGPYTLSSTAPLTALTGYLRGGSSTQPIRTLIYTDSGGQPDTLVAASQQVTIAAGQAAGWVDFPLTSSPTLRSGKYWLGYWFGGSGVEVYYDDVSGSGRYVPVFYSATGAPPISFGNGSGSSLAFSLYATLGAGSP